jgi:ElaA protein
MSIRDHRFADLNASEFHDIVRLRVDVFVVEQACPYPELDGRDREPATRHIWVEELDRISAYVRVLDEGDTRRIGRVVTAERARGAGLAGRLVDHAVTATDGPWVLDAQSQLRAWYEDRGFVVTGKEFVEDGIPHVPMRRES